MACEATCINLNRIFIKKLRTNIVRRSEKGQSFPLGSTLVKDGANFSLFCKNGTSVELLLFDHVDDLDPVKVIKLDPVQNRTYHYWHVFVPGVANGQLYGYRISGPFEPWNGHRFDGTKLLLDPYAKAVAVPENYNRFGVSLPHRVRTPAMKSVIADMSLYNWEGDVHPKKPFARTVIYEMHVKGFTCHPNSQVEDSKRGTYAGLIEKIPYLVDLGITAVELLPVFAFDVQDCPKGLVNYWGYSPVSFFAPHHGYAASKDPLKILDEFRDMVKALHKAGIEVILDVVFNHTSEGDTEGPTFSFRGIENSMYYILEEDKTFYANYSGTGNTLNANQPIVRRMIVDSLHFWVTEMHVDGFRFDLASILSRDEKGKPIENPPVLWDIESDPELAGVKLIAEAWDAAGLYQVGSFAGDSWKEWNGAFRDDIRRFVKGDDDMLSNLVKRLLGSPDLYSYRNREPEQSVNFVTCHDGFTLNDLVSYNDKHNESNNENNRDGTNSNYSWNCGVEGPTDDPAVERLRTRQIKNFFTYTLLAIGTPMILMGDEVRKTQQGNNNAYCQDNEISWFDWSLLEKNADVHRFVRHLIRVRLQRDSSRLEYAMSLNQLLRKATVSWHGMQLNQPDWSPLSRSLAFTLKSLGGAVMMHYMMNAYHEALSFEIPLLQRTGYWKRWIDTSIESPGDICYWNDAPVVKEDVYQVQPRSVVILITRL